METNTASNVTFAELVNATIRANNSSDETSDYNISAEVQVTGTRVTGVQNGQFTMREGIGSGSFGADENSVHYDFYSIPDVDLQVKALREVNAFIDGARTHAPSAASGNNV